MKMISKIKQNKYLAYCDPYQIHKEFDLKDEVIIKGADSILDLYDNIKDWYISNIDPEPLDVPVRINGSIIIGDFEFTIYKIKEV